MAIAHSANHEGNRHDLVQHLRSVAETASRFADPLDAAALAYYAGLWHDLGKYHPDFQAYLARCEEKPQARGHGPDHKAAGAHFAATHGNPLASLLIQGHHGGLRGRAQYQPWLDEKLASGAPEQALELARRDIPDLEPGQPYLPPDFIRNDALAAEMFLRLAFSALVDADFLDTERHFNAAQAESRTSDLGLDALWQRFEANQAVLMRPRRRLSMRYAMPFIATASMPRSRPRACFA
jgi:CRISPR-associated endonuclease/helicase Cas3